MLTTPRSERSPHAQSSFEWHRLGRRHFPCRCAGPSVGRIGPRGVSTRAIEPDHERRRRPAAADHPGQSRAGAAGVFLSPGLGKQQQQRLAAGVGLAAQRGGSRRRRPPRFPHRRSRGRPGRLGRSANQRLPVDARHAASAAGDRHHAREGGSGRRRQVRNLRGHQSQRRARSGRGPGRRRTTDPAWRMRGGPARGRRLRRSSGPDLGGRQQQPPARSGRGPGRRREARLHRRGREPQRRARSG